MDIWEKELIDKNIDLRHENEYLRNRINEMDIAFKKEEKVYSNIILCLEEKLKEIIKSPDRAVISDSNETKD